MNTPGTSYDSFLPLVDLAQLADHSRKLFGYKVLFAGFGVVALGLLVKTCWNIWRTMRDQEADFVTPVVVTVFFIALLSFYKSFVLMTVYLVSHLGDTGGWNDQVVKTFIARSDAYAKWRHAHGSWSPGIWGIEGLTGMLYLLVEAWVVFMRSAQTFTLGVIITYGPLLLGFASLGGFLTPLALGWFWALVEVSAWSVTMDILLVAYAKIGMKDIPTDFVVSEEFVFGLVMFGLLVAIPGITSSLIRGSSASVISAGISTATQTVTMLATSRPAMQANSVLYQATKSGVVGGLSKTVSWARNGRGAAAPAAAGSDTSKAWNAAEAITSHRESRATAERGQEAKK